MAHQPLLLRHLQRVGAPQRLRRRLLAQHHRILLLPRRDLHDGDLQTDRERGRGGINENS